MIKPKKALMIQLRRIGDVLMCTPSIRAFKTAYPNCELDFLTELPAVLEGNPHLNLLIEVNRSRQYDPIYQFGLIRGLRRRKYDIVIDFFANPRSAYYSFLSGAPVRLSYGFGHRRWAYNLVPPKKNDPVYAAQDRLDLLKAADVRSDDLKLDFYPSDTDRAEANVILDKAATQRIVSVSAVSRRTFNRWPLDRYAEICNRLKSEYGYDIILLGGPGEEETIHTLASMISDVNPIVPRIDRLGLLGAIFERVQMHIGNDNGPKHIAVACGAPTFTIFGPHSHISWTYPDPDRHAYIRPADCVETCRDPRHICGDTCIRGISPEMVWNRLDDFIKRIRANKSSVKAS